MGQASAMAGYSDYPGATHAAYQTSLRLGHLYAAATRAPRGLLRHVPALRDIGRPMSLERPIRPGQPSPLGASYDGTGVNFAVFSELAGHTELCLFDDDGSESRLILPEASGFVHHGYVPDLPVGQRYGFR